MLGLAQRMRHRVEVLRKLANFVMRGHVDDCAEGILLAAERYDRPEPVNLASGEEVRIADLAATIARLCRFEGTLEWDPTQPDGQPRRWLDGSRAKNAFGFEAAIGLEVGLARTVAWYEEQHESHG